MQVLNTVLFCAASGEKTREEIKEKTFRKTFFLLYQPPGLKPSSANPPSIGESQAIHLQHPSAPETFLPKAPTLHFHPLLYTDTRASLQAKKCIK